MATTTIRVRTEVQQGLKAIADEDGRSIQDVAEEALDALRRNRHVEQVKAQLEALRSDPEAWADYLGEIESYPAGDGVIAPDTR